MKIREEKGNFLDGTYFSLKNLASNRDYRKRATYETGY
jgi:hypothetical protein